jgi:hypothetical protein
VASPVGRAAASPAATSPASSCKPAKAALFGLIQGLVAERGPGFFADALRAAEAAAGAAGGGKGAAADEDEDADGSDAEEGEDEGEGRSPAAPSAVGAATPARQLFSAAPNASAAAAACDAAALPMASVQKKGSLPQVAPGAVLFPSERRAAAAAAAAAAAGSTAGPAAPAAAGAATPPGETFSIRPMTKFRVQLVALTGKVPVDVDVQLLALLRE